MNLKELLSHLHDEREDRELRLSIFEEEIDDIAYIIEQLESDKSIQDKVVAIESTVSTTTSNFVYDQGIKIIQQLEEELV